MRFSKMHGLGNDFMLIDNVTQNVYLSPELIRRLANRNTGIGFDQMLVVEPSYDPTLDFHYRIFNADGSEVFQCANGARCFARFLQIKGLTSKKTIHISTQTGRMILEIMNDEKVCVNMGKPVLNPKKIPFCAKKTAKTYILQTAEYTTLCGVVSIGNPHCILQVEDVSTANVALLGPILESHERFPQRTNVGFMQIIDHKNINLRVYERGVGETQACGSGACAAVVVGIEQKLLDKNVEVNLPGGELSIQWNGPGHPLYMTGPAVHVYDGYINL